METRRIVNTENNNNYRGHSKSHENRDHGYIKERNEKDRGHSKACDHKDHDQSMEQKERNETINNERQD